MDDKEVKPSSDELYEIRNLVANTSHTIKAYTQTSMTVDEKDIVTNNVITETVKTLPLEIKSYDESTTQASFSINNINASNDKTAVIKKKGYIFEGKEYEENTAITGLEPMTRHSVWTNKGYQTVYDSGEYIVTLFVEYEDGERLTKNITLYTRTLNPWVTVEEEYPTKLKCVGEYSEWDADVEKIYIKVNGKTVDGKEAWATGLKPGESVHVEYFVRTKGGTEESDDKYFKTPSVKLTSLSAKAVKAREVVVAATTNLPDDEYAVGFEWRKYEVPEEIASSKGGGAIYDGKLEARLKNLSTSSFYRVRPYFEDVDGNMTYGEWMTFDPSDYSYSDPTVHTYADVQLTETSATLTGYVMAGSDEITEQGFEYWVANGNKTNAKKVTSTGQRMKATINELKDGTTYNFRTYAKTSKETIYGEEQTFTVGNGVDVDTDTEETKTIQEKVTLSSAGYATFYNADESFKLPSGLSALVVVEYSSGKLSYKTIANGDANGIIPKAVPVILVSNNKTGGTYTLTSTTESATYTGNNLLHGSNKQTVTSNVNGVSSYGNSSYDYYKLTYGKSGSANANKFGWYWGATNGAAFSIGGGKAWLALPAAVSVASKSFILLGDNATAIDGIEHSDIEQSNEALYNTSGQRVSKEYKGMIIRNGKKIIK